MAPTRRRPAAALASTLAWACASHGAAASGKGARAAESRLRITNACDKEPMWIAHEAGGGVGPDPQNVKLAPLASYDFSIPDGLSSTRYWPKMQCDAQGNACKLGGSGGPGETCDTTVGCGPPVDTKFEATFGQVGAPCDFAKPDIRGCDWLDISLVDGYTVPFKLEILGDCSGTFANATGGRVVDCSHLNFNDCPNAEDMGQVGKNINLKVVHPKTGDTVGCYSPCSKLSFRNWNNPLAQNHTPDDPVAKDYCCPTPPETPEACKAGPVAKTQFVSAVHRLCPGVYGYAYDDGMGLSTCPAGTKYHVTFYCPASRRSEAAEVVVI